jgi:hypothetical protein
MSRYKMYFTNMLIIPIDMHIGTSTAAASDARIA